MCIAGVWVLSAVLTASAAAGGEGVVLRPRLEQGAAWTYDLGFDVSLEADGAATRMTQQARLRLEVVEVDGEGGATVSAEVTSVSVRWAEGETVIEFSLGGEPAAEPTPRQTAVWAVVEALGASECTLHVGADGGVRTAGGFARAYAVLAQVEGDARRVAEQALGLFTPAQFEGVASSIWNPAEAAGKACAAGDAWEEARPLTLGPSGEMSLVLHWRVEEATDEVVRLLADLTLTAAPNDERPAGAPTVEVASHEGAVEATWSVPAGVLESRVAEQSLTLGMSLGDQAVRVVREVRITIERVDEG